MAPQQGFHFDAEFPTKSPPVAIIFGVNEQCCNQVDILDIQPAPGSDQKIGSTIYKRKLRFGYAAAIPPSEVSIKIALRIVENESNSPRLMEAGLKCCLEISLCVPTQCIGPEIKCDA